MRGRAAQAQRYTPSVQPELMRRTVIFISVVFVMFAMVGSLLLYRYFRTVPNRAELHTSEQKAGACAAPQAFRAEMLQASSVFPNEPAKIKRIRLADDKSPSSDFLVDIENVSAKRITDLWYVVEPYADCPNGPSLPKFDISTTYPGMIASARRRFLRPHETITLRVPRETYESTLNARNSLQCPCTVASKIWFYGAGFVGEPFLLFDRVAFNRGAV